jgi:glutamate racemase
MVMHAKPIGMFDSGLGGLTVMQQLMRVLPNEDIVYFGDTARLPYGTKSRETVARYSLENSHFLIQKNVKMLVVACHTASAHALELLQQTLSIPVMGVIEPGVKSAINETKNGRIGVLGTKGTINSQSYQKAMLRLNPNILLFPAACPLFVPLVEEGYTDHMATHLIVKEYLVPLLKLNIDTLLLGCTHYPLLKQVISSEVGAGVNIIDPAAACAEQVKKMLCDMELRREELEETPNYGFYVSDDPEKFRILGERFLGHPIEAVQKLGLS